MPTPIDPKRLPALKAALAEYGEDERVSQKQLAELYGVAPSRISSLAKTRFPDFPPAERHDDKTHWYPARAAVASMIRYMEDSARGKQAQARRHTKVMGAASAAPAAPDDNEPPPLTAAEIDRLASAQTRLWKLRKDQGLYVLASEVQTVARGANALVTREVMNIINVIDPNGQLPQAQRDRLKNHCRDVVLKLHKQLERFLGDDDAEPAPRIATGGSGTERNLRRRRVR